MISWRNRGLRLFLQFVFKFAHWVIRVENFFLRRRKMPALAGVPGSYEDQIERLNKVYAGMKEPKYWAQTSGTRKAPKLIPYDKKRTKLVQKTFLKSMITLTATTPGQKTFFVISALNQDQSLTSGLLDADKTPNLIELLQAPYRYLQTPDGRVLREFVGGLSARMIVMFVSQPRFLYATNPSSISHFLNEFESNWMKVRDNISRVLKRPEILKSILELSDGDGEKRLIKFLEASKQPSLFETLPELNAIISWDGGYVDVFLNQLKQKYPHLKFIPMFSMSTEAIETVPHLIRGKIYFLPTASGTYAEFLDPQDGKVLKPGEVEVHKTYTLLITDNWGLNRYDTQDLFLVKDMIDGLPDLIFVKRRGMTSSLTGEKITEDHILLLAKELKTEFPDLANVSISLYPIERNGSFGYRLAIIGQGEAPVSLKQRADELLSVINSEYASKVSSGRLLPLEIIKCSTAELALSMGNKDNWESQFKVVPLYEKIIKAN